MLKRKVRQNLIMGDCFDVLDKLPAHSIDLVITDPPYDVKTTGGGGTINNIKKLDKSLKDLTQDGKDITKSYDIEKFAKKLLRVMSSVNVYFWCNKAQIPEYLRVWVDELGCKFDILFWCKTNALPTYSNKYLSDTEYLLYFHKGKGKCFPQSYEDAKTYYLAPINHKDKKKWGHPTIKPLDITEKLIRNSSKAGDTVLDPFMGSGTVGVACKNLSRNFIGVELVEEWFDLAKKRMEVVE